jgi:hypothetical protein
MSNTSRTGSRAHRRRFQYAWISSETLRGKKVVNELVVEVLGIDIGGVIIDGVREDGEMRSEPPEVPGAFTAIAKLSERRFRLPFAVLVPTGSSGGSSRGALRSD